MCTISGGVYQYAHDQQDGKEREKQVCRWRITSKEIVLGSVEPHVFNPVKEKLSPTSKQRDSDEKSTESSTRTDPQNATTAATITQAPASQVTQQRSSTSFYRRPLPDCCIPFSSAEGRRRFSSALANQGCGTYFKLAESYTTQQDPAFCGLGSLVMVLNALAVDPGRVWKGNWRWYHEELLDCCKPLNQIQKTGVNCQELQCLATCNGANAVLKHASAASPGMDVKCGCKDGSFDAFQKDVIETCAQEDQDGDAGSGPTLMICAYSRAHLGQTGSGHFSPISAYDKVTGSVLIMDVARFKYPPHWVPIKSLHEAMLPVDQDTGRPRGWLLISRPRRAEALASSMFLSVPTWDDKTSQAWIGLAQWLYWRSGADGSSRVSSHAHPVHEGLNRMSLEPEEMFQIVQSYGGTLSMLVESKRPKCRQNTERKRKFSSCCDSEEDTENIPGCSLGSHHVTEAHILTIMHEACERELTVLWGQEGHGNDSSASDSHARASPSLRSLTNLESGVLDDNLTEGAAGGLWCVSGEVLAQTELLAVRMKLRALMPVH